MAKLGLLSDVHGDSAALRLALDIFTGEGVELILCAGDLVEKGPHSDEVICIISEQNIPCVLGNHDAMAFDLAEESLRFLDALPSTIDITVADRLITVAHGTPHSYQSYLWPYSTQSSFEVAVSDIPGHILIVGHTHIPMQVEVSDKYIFNPGSVCATYAEGSGTCAILSLSSLSFKVIDIYTGTGTTFDYVTF